MTDKSCKTCFSSIPFKNEDDKVFCIKREMSFDDAHETWCDYYENKEEHVYTLEEVSRKLLEFCNELTYDIIFYSATKQIPSEKDCMAYSKWYRELADCAKELGVTL